MNENISAKLSKAGIRTGVELIDRQHLKYFSIVSHLIDNLGTREKNKTLFKDLNEYVIYHFHTEEDFMLKYHYDKALPHRKQHQYFTAKINEFSRLYSQRDDIDMNMKMKLSCFLIDWLVNHIENTDKRLCEFIITQSKMHSGILAKLSALLHQFIARYGDSHS